MYFALFLPTFPLFTYSITVDYVTMEDRKTTLFGGQSITINFNQPYGVLIMREWQNAQISLNSHNPSSGQTVSYSPVSQGSNKIGLYFGEYIGSATITAFADTYVRYSMVIFPNDCITKYISNTKQTLLTISQRNYMINSSVFCYFNSAQTPINYRYHFALKENINFIKVITDSADSSFNSTGIGSVNQTLKTPALIKITTVNVTGSEYVSIQMDAPDANLANYNFTGILDSSIPTFIVGKATSVSYKLRSSVIVGLSIVVMILVATLLYIIHEMWYKRKIDNRITTSVDNNQTNHVNQNMQPNTEDNALEDGPDSDGRYQTPSHMNIEQISTSFEQDFKTKELGKISTHFNEDLINENEENNCYCTEINSNGYPVNDYCPPSGGFVVPSSFTVASDNEGTLESSILIDENKIFNAEDTKATEA